MSKETEKLIEDIIELVLENMDCQHEVSHDEDGDHTSVEYNLNYGATVRVKIMALLKPKVTEEWTDKKAKEIKALIKDAQDEDLDDPVTSLHYLGLSLDIVTSIVDDLRPRE